MSLLPCRACMHKVDISAEACPSCGATDPAKKISRQQRNLIFTVVQSLFWLLVFGYAAIFVYTEIVPMAKSFMKSAPSKMVDE